MKYQKIQRDNYPAHINGSALNPTLKVQNQSHLWYAVNQYLLFVSR